MNLDLFTNLLGFFQIAVLAKLFLLVLGFFYFVFAIVIYRQISLMAQTVKSSFSGFLKLAALAQILAVAGLLVLVFLLV